MRALAPDEYAALADPPRTRCIASELFHSLLARGLIVVTGENAIGITSDLTPLGDLALRVHAAWRASAASTVSSR